MMSTNAGKGNDKNGVDSHAVGEQTNGVPSSSQTKVNQEKQETAAKTTPTVTRNSTQPKEELQTPKTKRTSSHSNTDSTQIENKSGGAQPLLKRVGTTFGRVFSRGNRKQQGHDNDFKGLPEDAEIQGQDKPATDLLPRPEQGEKVPVEQQGATDSPQNNEDLPASPLEQPTNPLSITAEVEDNTKPQQDRDQDDFVHLEKPGNSGSEMGIKEPEKVLKHEMEIASLTTLVSEHSKTIASLKESLAENNKAIASLRDQLCRSDPGPPTPNDKVEMKSVLKDDSEVTTSPIQEQPGENLVFRKADGISLIEVANLVKELNAQIDQLASHIIDLLLNRESSSSGKDSEIAGDGLRNDLQNYLGSRLCDELQRRSEEPEIDQMVAQIALQAGLVHACSRIINDWNPPFWTNGLAFSCVYDNIARVEGPITADTWRALTRNFMGLHEAQLEANKTYLEEVLLKLIIAVSGPQKSGEALLQQCHEKVDDIVRKAIDIHQVISQEARSTDLSTFTIESGTDFDQYQMEDTEGSDSKRGPTLPSKVVCTIEMGLRGKKRASSRQQSGDGKVGGGVTLKAKVVLPATLGE